MTNERGEVAVPEVLREYLFLHLSGTEDDHFLPIGIPVDYVWIFLPYLIRTCIMSHNLHTNSVSACFDKLLAPFFLFDACIIFSI